MKTKEEAKPSWSDKDKSHYSEGGALVRHYSTVRTTLMSIGLTVLFALWTITFLYAQDRTATLAIFGISVCVFLFVCAVGIFFSNKYEQSRQYMLRLERGEENRGPYSVITTSYKRSDMKLDVINWWIVILGLWLQLTLLLVKFEIFALIATWLNHNSH